MPHSIGRYTELPKTSVVQSTTNKVEKSWSMYQFLPKFPSQNSKEFYCKKCKQPCQHVKCKKCKKFTLLKCPIYGCKAGKFKEGYISATHLAQHLACHAQPLISNEPSPPIHVTKTIIQFPPIHSHATMNTFVGKIQNEMTLNKHYRKIQRYINKKKVITLNHAQKLYIGVISQRSLRKTLIAHYEEALLGSTYIYASRRIDFGWSDAHFQEQLQKKINKEWNAKNSYMVQKYEAKKRKVKLLLKAQKRLLEKIQKLEISLLEVEDVLTDLESFGHKKAGRSYGIDQEQLAVALYTQYNIPAKAVAGIAKLFSNVIHHNIILPHTTKVLQLVRQSDVHNWD